MTLTFPSNPAVGDTTTTGGRTFQWNGRAWNLVGSGFLIPDAPNNSITYGRRNGAWIDIASAANLQFRQGTDADRLVMSPVPLSGEPIWTTDGKRLFVGDGTTVGGVAIFGSSTSYVLGMPGDDIPALYTRAKALTPGGTPLSATNRAALVLAPGVYSVAALLNFDGEFVDVIGLGSSTHRPAVRINGVFTHKVTANDIRIVGLWVNDFQMGGDVSSGPATTLPLQHFENCRTTQGFMPLGTYRTFAGTLVGCRADGTASCFFSSNFSTPPAHFSGTAINCTAPSAARAFGGGATVTGTFRDCTTTGTIGHALNFPYGYGQWINCTGGTSSFGANTGSMHLFVNCRATTVAGNTGGAFSRYVGCIATAGAFPTTVATSCSCTISQANPAVVYPSAGILPPGTEITLTTTGTLPSPLQTGTTYYVLNPVAGVGFNIAATLNGTPINTTTAGSVGSTGHAVNVTVGGKVRNCYGADFAEVNAG